MYWMKCLHCFCGLEPLHVACSLQMRILVMHCVPFLPIIASSA